VENCQRGVCLPSAGPQGHGLLDRARSLPKAWTNDEARCTGAGIPAARRCATTPQRAPQRLQRALDQGVPAAWGTGESVYGDNRSRRRWWEEHHPAPVVAISGKAYVWRAGRPPQVTTILAALAAAGWCRLRAGDGAQGPRWSDWRWLPLAAPLQPPWRRWLWVRRSLSAPTELTAYVVCAPPVTVLETVVPVAGSRWTVARCCEAATGEVGLAQYAVRSWTGGDRPLTLAMWASALLTALRAAHLPTAPP
jgi:SRSO17 transposase